MNAVALVGNSDGTFHVLIKEISNKKHDKLPVHDFWNGTRFLLNRDLFPEKLSNFEGKILE